MVKRGRTYTFISEGGDVKGSNNYHPFYLTNSITGGRDLNTDAERAKEIVYAGYDENGNPLGGMVQGHYFNRRFIMAYHNNDLFQK